MSEVTGSSSFFLESSGASIPLRSGWLTACPLIGPFCPSRAYTRDSCHFSGCRTFPSAARFLRFQESQADIPSEFLRHILLGPVLAT